MLIPIGLIVAVCSADALSPPDVHLRPLLVAAPALDAAVAGPVPTALISGLTLAADVIVAALQGALFTENLYAQIGALIVVSALVFVFTVVRERSERRLSHSRSVAAVAQRVLLRPLPHTAATSSPPPTAKPPSPASPATATAPSARTPANGTPPQTTPTPAPGSGSGSGSAPKPTPGPELAPVLGLGPRRPSPPSPSSISPTTATN
ncbi:hypothetical protein [Streptomyces noursei]|uniref:hypothetical protein n=1 Tax=Streptomyces noursei TaxID=1971 RepID=UPI0030F13928